MPYQDVTPQGTKWLRKLLIKVLKAGYELWAVGNMDAHFKQVIDQATAFLSAWKEWERIYISFIENVKTAHIKQHYAKMPMGIFHLHGT